MNGILLAATVAVILLILLDLCRKINLMRSWWLAVYIPAALNFPLLCGWLLRTEVFSAYQRVWSMVLLCILIFYLWVRLNVFPIMDGRNTGLRLKAMIGGSTILYSHIYGTLVEIVIAVLCILYRERLGINGWLLTFDVVYGFGCCLFLFFNGILRVFLTSKRLSILRRVLILLVLWIPVVNWVMWYYTARLVREEYEYAYEKKLLEATRQDSEMCKTKYPLILVHGIAFRDSRYFNYWGRIPRALYQKGATIYYGNQEALGTIEYNAQDIRACIEKVIEETGAPKVNIIAHSKGGLDARYAISVLGMGDRVASLTTMCTPHRGCKFADTATKVPLPIYRVIARAFDKVFGKYGDKNPDFYTATKQFCTAPSAAFNERVLDVPGVYYQSYASVMKGFFSDSLLCIPYFFIRRCDGDNDGLVSVESAMWGNFKGTFRNRYRRGISHGDMIDLKREDYKGFDVVETYLGIVAELKSMGF